MSGIRKRRAHLSLELEAGLIKRKKRRKKEEEERRKKERKERKERKKRKKKRLNDFERQRGSTKVRKNIRIPGVACAPHTKE